MISSPPRVESFGAQLQLWQEKEDIVCYQWLSQFYCHQVFCVGQCISYNRDCQGAVLTYCEVLQFFSFAKARLQIYSFAQNTAGSRDMRKIAEKHTGFLLEFLDTATDRGDQLPWNNPSESGNVPDKLLEFLPPRYIRQLD